MSGYNFYLQEYINAYGPEEQFPVLNGLLLWYRFNEAGGNTAYAYIAGNNADLYNHSWGEGKDGGAIVLNGTSSYILLQGDTFLNFGWTDPFSFEFWFYLTNNFRQHRTVYERYKNPDQANEGIAIDFHKLDAGELNLALGTYNLAENWLAWCDDDVLPLLNQWHHWVVTYDGSKNHTGTKIYLDSNSRSMKFIEPIVSTL